MIKKKRRMTKKVKKVIKKEKKITKKKKRKKKLIKKVIKMKQIINPQILKLVFQLRSLMQITLKRKQMNQQLTLQLPKLIRQ